jgi:hypothetical protein
MKIPLLTFLILTAILSLVGCTTTSRSSVRIGSTQAQIHQGIENGEADLNLHPGKDRDPNLKVSAGFEKGVCNRIKYVSVSKRKISDHAVSVILCLNSRGVAWITREDSTPAKTTYLTIDGKYRAILTNREELFIVTNQLFEKSLKELQGEQQKSKASISHQPLASQAKAGTP